MSDDRNTQFHSEFYQDYVGKTVASIVDSSDGEGLRFSFADGTWVEVAFCWTEGGVTRSDGKYSDGEYRSHE